MIIDKDFFKNLADQQLVRDYILRSFDSAAVSQSQLLRFMDRYATWNGKFASGVARLVSNIGDSSLFMDIGFPRALADRSNVVASYIFDAARDEFNDHITRHRDPHRSLAQAFLQGIADETGAHSVLTEPNPAWLNTLSNAVCWRYDGGNSHPDPIKQIFAGIGFHLGSELLADKEFSLFDEKLRSDHNELVQKLLRKKVEIAGCEHRCYAWIGVHSGHDGAAEADHFDWALEGVNLALSLLSPDQQEQALRHIKLGYLNFVSMHSSFFSLVNDDKVLEAT